MASNNETKAKVTAGAMERKVLVRLPRALPGEETELFVGVNGQGFRIKKGVEVAVPEPVAEVLASSEKAKDAAFRYVDGLK